MVKLKESSMPDDIEIYVMDNLTLPQKVSGTRTKYPFDTMKVGQTFFLPEKKASKFNPYAAKFGRKNGFKFGCVDVSMKPVKDGDGNQVGWEPCKAGDKQAVHGCAVQRVNDDGTAPEVKPAAPQAPAAGQGKKAA